MEVVLKLSKKLSHLVVPDEVGLRMILIKPENTRKFCQVSFPFFPTKRKENIYSFKTTASELIILYTTYFSNCRAKWSLGAWDNRELPLLTDSSLMKNAGSHGWQIPANWAIIPQMEGETSTRNTELTVERGRGGKGNAWRRAPMQNNAYCKR